MIRFDIQLFGGRGSSSSSKGKAAVAPSPTDKGHSISGKPFNATDFKTWEVGQDVIYNPHERDIGFVDGQLRQGTATKDMAGKVKEVHEDYLIVDVPSISDHMYLDADNAKDYRAKKKR